MAYRSRQGEERAALWTLTTHDVAHRASRENISRLIEDHPEVADRIVPACPEWTVRELLVHVIERCRPEDPAPGHDSRPLRPIDELDLSELLDEWAQTGPQMERRLAEGRGKSSRIVMDTFTHELDLRRLLDVPPPDDHPALPTAMEVVLGGFANAVDMRDLPALRIETDGAQWTVGSEQQAATVQAHPIDLFRSFAGRRTHQQIAQLSWSAPAQRWLPAFTWGPFRPPAQATEELLGSNGTHH